LNTFSPSTSKPDDYWHVNTGYETVYAKRINKGRFRTYKWFTASLWLIYFFAPYIRWNGTQAILFDIPGRKFHLFSITLWPQDIWVLSLLLFSMAFTLFAVTTIAGRVFCGFFCFQTVWTDVFTFIEDKLEGAPSKRRRLDKAPWSFQKIRIKTLKHLVWLLIAVLTGVTFAAYFTDVFWLWRAYFRFEAPAAAWITLGIFTSVIYLFAGFLREQVCFWLCPYARIQGVMCDRDTIMPAYDTKRGLSTADKKGDCINCKLCVAVCPTGVDIRKGQAEGCITCGLCIDACNSVMDRLGRPEGLIRYASLRELEEGDNPRIFKKNKILHRPRVLVYLLIILASLSGIVYGLTHTAPVDFKVLHERQPLFVLLSNGNIQNKYILKIINKTGRELDATITVSGPDGITLAGVSNPERIMVGKVMPIPVFVRIAPGNIERENTPVRFLLSAAGADGREIRSEYNSMFIAPEKAKQRKEKN